jgi:hypothetical protein
MSKKQMEKNLDYGDCNNLICFAGSILETTMDKLEKGIDFLLKKD